MITLCVAYMVKNETANIEFSLNSIKTIADKIVVVDTGSTDNTIEKIKNWCNVNKIEVKIYERKWINFGFNRSELAVLTRNEATYTLFLDADMLVELDNFNKQELKADQYDLIIQWVGTRFYNPLLVNNRLSWQSVGIIHEYWYAEGVKTREKLLTLTLNHDRHGQARPKGVSDIKLLEQGIIDEPSNARYYFYLANSYRDVGEYQKAIETFEKRISMGGWDEEIFYSQYQIGYCYELLNNVNEAKIAYLKAWECRPTRAEPLYKISTLCRNNKEYEQAYLFAKKGLEIPYSKDVIFVNKPTYEYGLLFEKSIAAYWVGKYEEAIDDCIKLDKINNLPEDVKEVNRKNISWNEQKLFNKNYLITKFPGEKHHSVTSFSLRDTKLIKQNLKDMTDICNYFYQKFNLSLYLIYGTLLGAVREKGFIPHDTDIDFAYLSQFNTESDVKKELIELSWTLRKEGLLVKCHNDGGQIRVSSPNKRTVVDIWVSWIEKNEYNIIPYGKIGNTDIINPLKNIKFLEHEVFIPNNSEEFLDKLYIDWKNPIKKDKNFSKLTEWKRFNN